MYKIPVKGPDGHGYFFIRAEPRDGVGWVGVRLELEIEDTKHLSQDQFKDKRLVIFDCERHGAMTITDQ